MIGSRIAPRVRAIGLATAAAAALAIAPAWVTRPVHAANAQDERWLAVAPGRVEPASGLIKLGAPVGGLIQEVLIKANEAVFAGQALVRLADAEARAQLASAEAQVAMRKRVRNKESTPSGAGPRRRAEDGLADAQAALFDARVALDKAAAERRAGRGADADVETARTQATAAQTRLEQQADELRKVTADAPLPISAEGQLNVARSELQGARATLDKLTIRAPLDATILQVNARAGEVASPQATPPLVLLGDITALRVRAELDQRDLDKIKVGQQAVVRSEAFRGRDVAGKVAVVAPLVESSRASTLSQRNMTDVDVVEVLVDLAEPGPFAVGMKVDVYFRP
ncbi:efflux RND transporter periplasmic adaptor subunit [Bradyrhizobium ontarionense]|uniref:Efflux RND transporter periplasmic adaptor subunit n=1 Tax=Bradyrhizobium ontarionense TaxID=2898149 RepID=A0ABY3R3G1_9BRAD|nr:efflux RND transporter periplasmic adaptor subunit [Bradyrhizobium sp. A19]UFZ01577.1 efflux RND transporter periplasmic adaptor subunit [Bradyrhizobium sp. A19]